MRWLYKIYDARIRCTSRNNRKVHDNDDGRPTECETSLHNNTMCTSETSPIGCTIRYIRCERKNKRRRNSRVGGWQSYLTEENGNWVDERTPHRQWERITSLHLQLFLYKLGAHTPTHTHRYSNHCFFRSKSESPQHAPQWQSCRLETFMLWAQISGKSELETTIRIHTTIPIEHYRRSSVRVVTIALGRSGGEENCLLAQY